MDVTEEKGLLDKKVSTDGPVLEPLNKIMKIDLLVNEKGQVWICHDRPFPENIKWIEYDMDVDTLTFVTRGGKIHDYGELILPEVRTYLKRAERAYLVYMKDKKIEDMGVIKIVTRRIMH